MEKCTTAEGFVFHQEEPTFLISLILGLLCVLKYLQYIKSVNNKSDLLNFGPTGPPQDRERVVGGVDMLFFFFFFF